LPPQNLRASTIAIPVILWLRVSADSQNEDNQLPDLQRWCEEHGYQVVTTVRVHGKSAWKPGKLDKDKRQALNALSSGVASVVVAWAG
jgi:DNA invertase Pin-like site-specific DNA recombinase